MRWANRRCWSRVRTFDAQGESDWPFHRMKATHGTVVKLIQFRALQLQCRHELIHVQTTFKSFSPAQASLYSCHTAVFGYNTCTDCGCPISDETRMSCSAGPEFHRSVWEYSKSQSCHVESCSAGVQLVSQCFETIYIHIVLMRICRIAM